MNSSTVYRDAAFHDTFSEEYLAQKLVHHFGFLWIDDLMAAIKERKVEAPGICKGCTNVADEVHPEAKKVRCSICGEKAVSSIFSLTKWFRA